LIVAITGGTGFIGRKLVLKHLANNDTVRILTRKADHKVFGGEKYLGDIAIEHPVSEDFFCDVDVFYHCAAELYDTSRMEQVNVKGTSRLIALASGRVARWVQLSSVGAYGPVQSGTVTEQTVESPANEYEKTKTHADRLVREASVNGAFSSVILRPSNVFGTQMPNKSLCQLFSMIDRGLFFFMGPPGASANYVHVDDVVEALYLCGTHAGAAGHTFNVSDWSTFEQFVETVASELEKPIPKWRIPVAPVHFAVRLLERLPRFPLTSSRINALTTRVRYDSALIQRELGFAYGANMSERIACLAREWKNCDRG